MNQRMRYPLDLESLLIIFDSQKQDGRLVADLKNVPGVERGPCTALLTLNKGKILSAAIENRQGRLVLEGERAIRALKKMGKLEWIWTAEVPEEMRPAPVLSPPSSSNNVLALVPRRIIDIDRLNPRAFPRKHWQVLLLVDGTRTVSQIASLLMRSPSPSELQELVNVLILLQQQQIIIVTGR